MNLSSSRFLIIDCQTTGMRPSVGSLLEIAWAWGPAGAARTAGAALSAGSPAGGDALEICGAVVELPAGGSIPPRVREITGITAADLVSARSVEELRAEFRGSLAGAEAASSDGVARAGAEARTVALIHYAQFEEAWLRDFLACEELPFDVICTHRVAKKLFPQTPSRNVRGLTGFFGTPMNEVKRAPQHVEATWRIWQALVPALANEGITTIDELRAWLSAKPAKKVAGGKAPSYEYRVDRAKRLALPEKPGIYKMIAKGGEILYVGKATCLKDRVNSYFRGKKGRDPRKLELMAQVWDLEVVECGSAIEAALVESDEIKRLNPPYNVSLKEGNRALIYYDRALGEESLVHSVSHPVGPFRRFNAVEHLRVWAKGLEENLIRNVFYEPIEATVLEQGYALFEEKYPAFAPRSTRDHLALGVKLLRSAVEEEIEEEEVLSEEELELTPEEILEKIERLYVRAASTYLRAKELTRLLWSDVRWSEKGEEKSLTVRGGRLDAGRAAAGASAEAGGPRPARWAGLTISDYDRMSVLLMEISKIDHDIEYRD